MSPEEYQQVKAVFQSALELEPPRRAEFLAAACQGNADLQREVERLLRNLDTNFLEAPAVPEAIAEITGGSISTGDKIGRYEIISHLGQGGMGEVYLARDKSLGREVAVKVLLPEFTSDKERVKRFKLEAKAASALNHPNIITIHEINEETERLFITTEHIQGQTLRSLIAKKQLNLTVSIRVAWQIAEALAAAHQAGIIHRDIKPENLMLRADGLVKVLDFGLAKPIQAKAEMETSSLVQTKVGVVMGSVSYMSPEQARGLAIDARTDLWSLGVVFYEMLTGRSPFRAATMSDTLANILRTEPQPLVETLPEAPAKLGRIVGKLLRKEPGERYQTAQDLALDLNSLSRELEFAAQPEPSQTPPANSISAEVTRMFSATPSGANASDLPTMNTVSSAEYLVGEVKKHKRGVTVALLVLLFAFGCLGYWLIFQRAAGVRQIESIAVMPFQNEGGNAEIEYLSDGMTETLIGSLLNIPNLSVKARSSVFRYKGKTTDTKSIGQELNVQAILNGRVAQRGEQLMLSLELIDVDTENVIWSGQYVRQSADLVSLQSEIARDVANKLKTRLSGADQQKLARNYTDNPEAYQLYLKGRFHWNKRTPRDLQKAVEYFHQAIARDPNYALAYAGLADSYTLLSSFGGAPPPEAMPKAKAAALRAMSLDNQIAEPHVAIGYIAQYFEYDFAEAEREYKRAIELNPNYAIVLEFYGTLLSNLGKHEEAHAEFRRALELEPLSLGTNRMYGEMLFFARRYDQAIAQLKRTIELDDSFASAHRSLSRVYFVTKNYAGHVEEYTRYYELIGEPNIAALMRESFAKGGWKGYLQAMTGEQRPTKYFFPFYVAIYYAELGDKDTAFAELDKTFEERLYYIAWIKADPWLDSLRGDPRFQKLLKKAGLS